MKLDNPFPLEVRNLFLGVYWCFECGRSDRGLELHHIWGRISGSALNACPLCKVCHDHILHNQATHRRLLAKVIEFLSAQRYRLKPVDEVFLTTVQNDLAWFDTVLK